MGLLARVGSGKHRGLGVGRDSGGSNPVGGRPRIIATGRDRGSDGSGYGRSLSLAVATTRTGSPVGGIIILVVSLLRRLRFSDSHA